MAREKRYRSEADKQAAYRQRQRSGGEQEEDEEWEVEGEKGSAAGEKQYEVIAPKIKAMTEREKDEVARVIGERIRGGIGEKELERRRLSYGPYFLVGPNLTGDECANFWKIMQERGEGRRIGKAREE